MNTLTSFSFAELLVDAGIRTSVLLLLAFGVAQLLRRGSAAARHLVWATALAGALLLPLLSATLPSVRVPLPDAVPSFVASALDWASPAPDRPSGEAPEIGQVSSEADRSALAGERVGGVAGLAPGEWIFLLWVAGALLMAGKLSAGVIGLSRLGRRSSMVTDGGWLHLSHDLARRLGATRGVTLLHGDGPAVPMTWGVLQPVIWLPVEADSWTEERRRVVLAHELAHVRRRDALTQWIGHLAVAMYWFNPLVWIAARRLQEERERACDDTVLRLGTPSVSYADHLLEVARKLSARPAAPHAAMAMTRSSPLIGRMQSILDRSTARDSVGRWRGLVFIASATGCILLLAALRAEDAGAQIGAASANADNSLPGIQRSEPAAGQPSGSDRMSADAADPSDGTPHLVNEIPPTAPRPSDRPSEISSRLRGASDKLDGADRESSITGPGISRGTQSSSRSGSASVSQSASSSASSDAPE